jgi:hypothetical protein
VPLLTHGRWLAQALYVLWKQRVSAAFWLLPADPVGSPRLNFDAGLYFSDGRPKPAVTAFQFPFITVRRSANTLSAWGRAPFRGTIAIQRLSGHRWITVMRLRARARGIFLAPVSVRGHALMRAREGAVVSLTWPQS